MLTHHYWGRYEWLKTKRAPNAHLGGKGLGTWSLGARTVHRWSPIPVIVVERKQETLPQSNWSFHQLVFWVRFSFSLNLLLRFCHEQQTICMLTGFIHDVFSVNLQGCCFFFDSKACWLLLDVMIFFGMSVCRTAIFHPLVCHVWALLLRTAIIFAFIDSVSRQYFSSACLPCLGSLDLNGYFHALIPPLGNIFSSACLPCLGLGLQTAICLRRFHYLALLPPLTGYLF